MTSLDDARLRSTLMAERIRLRTDHELRQLIDEFTDPVEFRPLDALMISEQAWQFVAMSGIEPKQVFAHPVLLQRHPRTSQYYRGIALLPQKRVADIAVPVAAWEDGSRKAPITTAQSMSVAQLYNAVVSSIIEGATNWTLENGYRNIIANMGIGLDGTFRNIIGRDAENLVKTCIRKWLIGQDLTEDPGGEATEFCLPNGYSMRFGSEPDVLFRQERDGCSERLQRSKSRVARTLRVPWSGLVLCRRVSKRHRPTV